MCTMIDVERTAFNSITKIDIICYSCPAKPMCRIEWAFYSYFVFFFLFHVECSLLHTPMKHTRAQYDYVIELFLEYSNEAGLSLWQKKVYLASFLRPTILLFHSNSKLTVMSSSNNNKKNNKHEYHLNESEYPAPSPNSMKHVECRKDWNDADIASITWHIYNLDRRVDS